MTTTSIAPTGIDAVRSTMIAASQLALRELGLDGAYFRDLPHEHHETMRSLGVGAWLPVEIAVVHYRTYDRMDIGETRIDELTHRVAQRVHGTALRTLGGIVKQTGFLSAPLLVRFVPRLWERSFRGGLVSLEAVGIKDVRLKIRGLGVLGTSPFFRSAMTRHYRYGIGLFSKQCEVKPLPSPNTDSYLARLTWD